MKVDLIDIGIGNTGSVKRCLQNLGAQLNIVNAFDPPEGKYPIVMPGVGQFGAVMEALSQNNLAGRLSILVQSGVPYLGICSGLQVLLEGSEEAPDIPGLGLIKGSIVRFRQGKVPQIGWNIVRSKDRKEEKPQYAYFVNSFYAKPLAADVVSHSANYFDEFCAAIKSKNITAAQFHPEKSSQFGLEFLRGWLNRVRK